LIVLQITFHYNIVNKCIWAWDGVENAESIGKVAIRGQGTEFDYASHSIVGSGETKLKEEGVILLEFSHG